MCGKLDGIDAINTDPLSNWFCKLKRKSNHICSQCYSRKMLLTYRSYCRKPFKRNLAILSEKIIRIEDLPVIKSKIFRFHSHGELLNGIHLMNFIRIADYNQNTVFALWSKRKDLLNRYASLIPRNMITFYSTPMINPGTVEIPKGFKRVFSIYTEDHAGENNIEIHCKGKKCIECMRCYRLSGEQIVNELVKQKNLHHRNESEQQLKIWNSYE